MGIVKLFRNPASSRRARRWLIVLLGFSILGLTAPSVHSINTPPPSPSVGHLLGVHLTTGPDNWSGYEVTGAVFTEVEGDWNTQCQASGEPAGATIATWVGLGGENNTALLQAGTVWKNGAYHIFTEWVGAQGQGSGPSIRPTELPCGVPVFAQVYSNATGDPANPWCVLVSAGTDYVDFCGNWPPGQSTAEWMDDRPICISPSSFAIGQAADFNYTEFSQAYAESNTGRHTILGYAHHAVLMHDINGLVMAAPDPTSSATSFVDRWKHFDPGASASCTV